MQNGHLLRTVQDCAKGAICRTIPSGRRPQQICAKGAICRTIPSGRRPQQICAKGVIYTLGTKTSR